MVAMLFILFDIEVVFLYPVGVILEAADSVFVLVEILDLRRPAAGRASSTSGARGPSIGGRAPQAARARAARAAAPPEELRVRQLRARDMLRGDLEGADLERYVEERVVTTTLEKVLNWARANSMFPLTFGLACCAIEAPIAMVGRRATTSPASAPRRCAPRRGRPT